MATPNAVLKTTLGAHATKDRKTWTANEQSEAKFPNRNKIPNCSRQEAKPNPDIITYNDSSVIDACAKSGAIEKSGDAEKKSGDEEKASPSGIMEKTRFKRKRKDSSSSCTSSSCTFIHDDDNTEFKGDIGWDAQEEKTKLKRKRKDSSSSSCNNTSPEYDPFEFIHDFHNLEFIGNDCWD